MFKRTVQQKSMQHLQVKNEKNFLGNVSELIAMQGDAARED